MRFPLDQRIIIGYTWGKPTDYTDFHLGVDYRARYDPLLAPHNGRVERFYGNQGGLTIHFYPDGTSLIIRFLHLDYIAKLGAVKEGDLIGTTGNTGLSSFPHLHLDISRIPLNIADTSRFIDPEVYFSPPNPIDMAVQKVVAAQKKKLEAIQNGLIASAFDPSTGKTYLIRNNKKEERPVVEVLNALLVPAIDKATLDQIPV